MIACPWCGTNFATFQPDCPSCGGPMTAPAGDAVLPPEASLLMPPSPPRSINDRYLWRVIMTDGWAIAAFVFLLLGVVFMLVGVALTLAVITAIVGIPFLGLGFVLVVAGVVVAGWRYQEGQKIVGVLRDGEAVIGQVTQAEQNLHVRVGESHPWVIRYAYRVSGQTYKGQVSTLNPPGPELQPGKQAWVLYLPSDPDRNSLYPHP